MDFKAGALFPVPSGVGGAGPPRPAGQPGQPEGVAWKAQGGLGFVRTTGWRCSRPGAVAITAESGIAPRTAPLCAESVRAH